MIEYISITAIPSKIIVSIFQHGETITNMFAIIRRENKNDLEKVTAQYDATAGERAPLKTIKEALEKDPNGGKSRVKGMRTIVLRLE